MAIANIIKIMRMVIISTGCIFFIVALQRTSNRGAFQIMPNLHLKPMH